VNEPLENYGEFVEGCRAEGFMGVLIRGEFFSRAGTVPTRLLGGESASCRQCRDRRPPCRQCCTTCAALCSAYRQCRLGDIRVPAKQRGE
jgi:hypothetical protein